MAQDELHPEALKASEASPPVAAGAGDSTASIGDAQAAAEQPAAGSGPPRPTTAGRMWVTLGVGAIVLVLLIIFIAENSRAVKISFLGASGSISLGLAMLIAAVAGALVALLIGTARILQLRYEVRRQATRASAAADVQRR